MTKFEVDEQEVNKIVDTMKKKYREEGIEFEDEVNTSLKELRGIITNDSYSRIDIESKEDIEGFESNLARKIGSFYLKTKALIKPIQKFIKNFPISEEIGFYLYSANMKYSANQYLALASAGGVVVALVVLIVTILLGILSGDIIIATVLPIVITLLAWFMTTLVLLTIPKQRAVARGNACSSELPFALRHMSTELKAGIGLYKTVQAIASNDYGVLSDEFARTISEIEEGSDTSVALKHLALRTQSRPLKKTINHILRAMRIGGNLSSAMNDIAEDVSEELQNKIEAFSQNMNFFSVIFIFVGIVLPVAIMILGAIRNSPIAVAGENVFASIPLTPELLTIFFLVGMPIIFFMLLFLVSKAQPTM